MNRGQRGRLAVRLVALGDALPDAHPDAEEVGLYGAWDAGKPVRVVSVVSNGSLPLPRVVLTSGSRTEWTPPLPIVLEFVLIVARKETGDGWLKWPFVAVRTRRRRCGAVSVAHYAKEKRKRESLVSK